MARPRTPQGVAAVTGADKLHPGRHASRKPIKLDGLGPAPDYLTAEQSKCWAMFSDEMPWLAKSDRTLVEAASRLRARMMTEPEFGVNALAQLRMCISSMGGTPADRSKVTAPDDQDSGDDPSAEFLN